MEENKLFIPDTGYVDFYGDRPENLPKLKVIKCSSKRHDPIEVKRSIRPGFRELKHGESWNWQETYH